MPQFTDDEVGKTVIEPDGEEVGVVQVVEDGVPYVEPHPDWTDRLKASFGLEDDPDIDEYPLEDEYIDEVTDDHVRLRQSLPTDRSGHR